MYSQTLAAPVLRVSSPLSPRSVPSIQISLADSPILDTPALDPSSPEDSLNSRSTHLLPPPGAPVRRLVNSKNQDKKGLDQATFQDLLAANRERLAHRVSSADRLRREVVVKAHHSKQLERRALFLSRIAAPPSPTSAETAVTPPESPAIFHFSLPSPGLASPLELFETVTSRETWIEQVDYKAQRSPAPRLPSLDQITARLRPTLNTNVAVPSIVVESPTPVAVQPINIIKGNREDEVKPRSRIPATILASTRARAASPPSPSVPVPVTPDTPSQLIIPASPPKSIKPVLLPQTIPALRVNKPSGPELAPVPVMSWRDREASRPRAHLAESWRRETPKKVVPQPVMSLPVGKPVLPAARDTRPGNERRTAQGRNMVDKLRRRTSAPAELQGTLRKGVPVGGF